MMAPVKRARILVVEDEAIVARDIASQVQDLGYETVGIAASAEHAMQMVERVIGAIEHVLAIRQPLLPIDLAVLGGAVRVPPGESISEHVPGDQVVA